MTEPIISINDSYRCISIEKALNNVTMDFYPNEIHGPYRSLGSRNQPAPFYPTEWEI